MTSEDVKTLFGYRKQSSSLIRFYEVRSNFKQEVNGFMLSSDAEKSFTRKCLFNNITLHD